MSEHTKGPWVVLPEEVDKDYIRIRGSVLGSRYKIANVITPTYDGVHEREAKETRANAYLIAAAPQLLAACKRQVANIERWLETDIPANAEESKSIYEELKAAVKAAEGDQPC